MNKNTPLETASFKKISQARKLRKAKRYAIDKESRTWPESEINRDLSKYEGNFKPGGFIMSSNIHCFGSVPILQNLELIQQNTAHKTHVNQETVVSDQNNVSQQSKSSHNVDRPVINQFPNLVLFYGAGKKDRGLKFLKQSFLESSYGSLEMNMEKSGAMFKALLILNGECLEEAEGTNKNEALQRVVINLLKRLRSSAYSIEAKQNYFQKKKFPDFVRNIDSSQSHIYKVVCLKKPFGPAFPHLLTGPVEYVTNEEDLWKYIANHARTGNKADLFVLNIEKSQRAMVSSICQQNGMLAQPLNGCSDRGSVVSHKENVREILQELIQCGGENMKYRLIPPKRALEDEDYLKIDDSGVLHEDSIDGDHSPHLELMTQLDNLEITPWIVDNLILMDIFDDKSRLQPPRELLFVAVKESPGLELFIIEKKTDNKTRLITAEAMIDRKVVGRAQSFNASEVKIMAAQKALENLKTYCYYIQAKQSYFGVHGNFPEIFSGKCSSAHNNIYRIVQPEEVCDDVKLQKVLQIFKSSVIQDIFFLENIPQKRREEACRLAKKLKLSVRQFVNKYVCVYKKRRFKEVLNELMSTDERENIKYKLVEPSKKLKQHILKQHDKKGKSLEQLFDYQEEDLNTGIYKQGSLSNQSKRSCADLGKQSRKTRRRSGRFRKSNPQSANYPDNSNQERWYTTCKDSSNWKPPNQKLHSSNLPHESSEIRINVKESQADEKMYLMYGHEEDVWFEDSSVPYTQESNPTYQNSSCQKYESKRVQQPDCGLSYEKKFNVKDVQPVQTCDINRRMPGEFVHPKNRLLKHFNDEKDFKNQDFNLSSCYSRDGIKQNMLITPYRSQGPHSSRDVRGNSLFSKYPCPNEFDNKFRHIESGTTSEPLWSRRGYLRSYDAKNYTRSENLYSRRSDEIQHLDHQL